MKPQLLRFFVTQRNEMHSWKQKCVKLAIIGVLHANYRGWIVPGPKYSGEGGKDKVGAHTNTLAVQ